MKYRIRVVIMKGKKNKTYRIRRRDIEICLYIGAEVSISVDYFQIVQVAVTHKRA